MYVIIDFVGTCTGVVVQTGDKTVIGGIAYLTGSIVEDSKQNMWESSLKASRL